jgi:hypothetical protein
MNKKEKDWIVLDMNLAQEIPLPLKLSLGQGNKPDSLTRGGQLNFSQRLWEMSSKIRILLITQNTSLNIFSCKGRLQPSGKLNITSINVSMRIIISRA